MSSLGELFYFVYLLSSLHSIDMLLKHDVPVLTNSKRRFQRLSGSCSLGWEKSPFFNIDRRAGK